MSLEHAPTQRAVQPDPGWVDLLGETWSTEPVAGDADAGSVCKHVSQGGPSDGVLLLAGYSEA
jgi:hypothetical protein